jgi:hypothetical protein
VRKTEWGGRYLLEDGADEGTQAFEVAVQHFYPFHAVE